MTSTKNAKKDNGRRWTHAVMNNMLDVLDQGVAAEGSCCTRSTFVNEAIKEKAQRSVAAAKRYRQAQAYWSYFNGSTRLGETPLSYEDWLAQRSQVDVDAKEQGPASQPEPVAKVTTPGNDTTPVRGSITSDAVLAELGISPHGVAGNPFGDEEEVGS